jgi:hypothetical protein
MEIHRECLYLCVSEDIRRAEVSMHNIVHVEEINGRADLPRHHLDHLDVIKRKYKWNLVRI